MLLCIISTPIELLSKQTLVNLPQVLSFGRLRRHGHHLLLRV